MDTNVINSDKVTTGSFWAVGMGWFAGPPADQSQRPLAGAHQGEMLRVEVEAIIIPEGESEVVWARNGG